MNRSCISIKCVNFHGGVGVFFSFLIILTSLQPHWLFFYLKKQVIFNKISGKKLRYSPCTCRGGITLPALWVTGFFSPDELCCYWSWAQRLSVFRVTALPGLGAGCSGRGGWRRSRHCRLEIGWWGRVSTNDAQERLGRNGPRPYLWPITLPPLTPPPQGLSWNGHLQHCLICPHHHDFCV